MSVEKVGMTLAHENEWPNFISQINIVIKTTT